MNIFSLKKRQINKLQPKDILTIKKILYDTKNVKHVQSVLRQRSPLFVCGLIGKILKTFTRKWEDWANIVLQKGLLINLSST